MSIYDSNGDEAIEAANTLDIAEEAINKLSDLFKEIQTNSEPEKEYVPKTLEEINPNPEFFIDAIDENC